MHLKTSEDKNDIKAFKVRISSVYDSHSHTHVFQMNSLKGGITLEKKISNIVTLKNPVCAYKKICNSVL